MAKVTKTPQKTILFVCMGNTCRSPMAEAIFRHLVKQRGFLDDWKIDSAAIIPYFVGEPPNDKTAKCLRSHGITDYHHEARVMTPHDFESFQHILCMDDYNIECLMEYEAILPQNQMAKFGDRIQLLGSYDPKGEKYIRDPYFTNNDSDFERVFQQCYRCCDRIIELNST